jgi:dTDP-4-dehydrorhamnose reductase
VKVTVLGANGMLGTDVVKVLEALGHEVKALTRKDVDLTKPATINDCKWLARKNADWVVNCTAYTAVDKAEEEPEIAFDVNEEGVLNLCGKLNGGPRLLHISTDFVFDGTATQPYVETDETNPLGVYGQSKLAGEHYAEAMLDDPIIFRTSWLFGPSGKSFPLTMINAHIAGRQLRVVADQFGCPTYTVDLATAIASALETNLETGIYHACGSESMSWHSFAERVLGVFKGEAVSIEKIGTADYPTPAKRPAYSVLNNAKLAAASISPWRPTDSAIEELIERLQRGGNITSQ